jgi:hypothetical protein
MTTITRLGLTNFCYMSGFVSRTKIIRTYERGKTGGWRTYIEISPYLYTIYIIGILLLLLLLLGLLLIFIIKILIVFKINVYVCLYIGLYFVTA